MAAELCDPLELQEEGLPNLQDNDASTIDSDADNDDDRAHFKKVSNEVLMRRKGMLQHWDKYVLIMHYTLI
jgi:hypothetical protein